MKIGKKDQALRQALWELVNHHQRLRPKLEIQDVYKLIYQSVFGVGHIIRSEAQALECLRRELDTLDLRLHPEEELVENISLDGSLVRINLRPFGRRSLDPNDLYQVLKFSAEGPQGTTAEFLRIWREFGSLVKSGAFGFDRIKFLEFDRFLKENKYPLMHHSSIYKRLYTPSYRVVKRDIFIQRFGEV